jgi:MoaA/NifB/PqqE/SkfB family radical SAM enzyme
MQPTLPGCFTGLGERSRPKSWFPLALYQQILNELGDYLMHIEFYNWGEPLLNKHIDEFVRVASGRGISTIIATNFSFPFDAHRAEALVASGLALLGVSLDGASQDTYQQYRIGGSFDTVLGNISLINRVKQELKSPTPRVVWSYHTFPHNRADVVRAKAMARELGVEISVTKGWVEGPDWDTRDEFPGWVPVPVAAQPEYNCHYLWERAVIHVDGGIAPCDGTFFKEDDYGRLGRQRFKAVWNNDKFRTARRLFHSRAGTEAGRHLICYDCPATVNKEDWRNHVARGGDAESFVPRFRANDGFNFFLQRRYSDREGRGSVHVLPERGHAR